ncbi:MAG: molybdenum cofactor synthesis domain-containing protein [Planctomycetota bacterium]|jgi:molybdenum cofactor synthesis domain-containing protein
MSNKIEVVSTNISTIKGTVKEPICEISIDNSGVVGDAHAGQTSRQVSIMAKESIERFAAQNNREIKPGEFAENLTIRGLDLSKIAILDRFRIGSVELEVSQIGKECHGEGCAIFQQIGKCLMPREGIFCRVIKAGKIKPKDEIIYEPKILSFSIITLSDRASRGEYEDKSGPTIKRYLENFFENRSWNIKVENIIIPDSESSLKKELEIAFKDNTDAIFTTGGTGVGPRDITVDIVLSLTDKLIPGIMESIRIKYGREKPNALLSRSVTAVKGKTLIYTLPGSTKAVNEYMEEILKTLEHLIFMLNEIDVHSK